MTGTDHFEAAPAPRGWPKGKPRKPQTEVAEETPDAFLEDIQSRVAMDRARMEAAREAEDASPRNQARSGQRKEQRLKREAISEDPLHIPDHLIPDGMSYEWKRSRIGGKPDQQHLMNMMRQHWRPVPAERHPELAWADSTSKYIEKDAVILMERPAYLTEEAQKERVQLSLDAINNQFQKLRGDAKERDYERASVKSTYTVDDDE
ncbi:hypothetical protein [Ancylobacter sp.]|uniref:hypothetical protein n=1 Tax=Ancylobacter sp. TaxID=1872567 RepID=UPI003BAA72E3